MNNYDRINELFDFDNKEKAIKVRQEYERLTETALKLVKETDGVDIETALRNRDIVFYEKLMEAISVNEKELGVKFTPNEKNTIINKIEKIIRKTDV